ncbi:MAG: D-aminoacyl-tRNA deacylase, partial [Chloroflexota bacterium]|nr:D-aminoacyl-tRNA deacylase [Chloroflexota bacterium]
MRAIVQRVSEAAVRVDGEEMARIGPGLLVLLGVKQGDTEEQAEKLAAKVRKLRVFEDAEGKMNLDVEQANGEILCVSQFTLYADTSRGNRPSFIDAAPPQEADPLYQLFSRRLEASTGEFGAHMRIELTNDGP